MSMANSLETRAPLLDYRVVEFAANIPSRLKLHGKDKKHILKKAFSGMLPRDVLYRKKMGFSVPLADWLRCELREMAELLLLAPDRKSTRLNSSHVRISYAVFCLKKKK